MLILKQNPENEFIVDNPVLYEFLQRVKLVVDSEFLQELVYEFALLYKPSFLSLVVALVF